MHVLHLIINLNFAVFYLEAEQQFQHLYLINLLDPLALILLFLHQISFKYSSKWSRIALKVCSNVFSFPHPFHQLPEIVYLLPPVGHLFALIRNSYRSDTRSYSSIAPKLTVPNSSMASLISFTFFLASSTGIVNGYCSFAPSKVKK